MAVPHIFNTLNKLEVFRDMSTVVRERKKQFIYFNLVDLLVGGQELLISSLCLWRIYIKFWWNKNVSSCRLTVNDKWNLKHHKLILTINYINPRSWRDALRIHHETRNRKVSESTVLLYKMTYHIPQCYPTFTSSECCNILLITCSAQRRASCPTPPYISLEQRQSFSVVVLASDSRNL